MNEEEQAKAIEEAAALRAKEPDRVAARAARDWAKARDAAFARIMEWASGGGGVEDLRQALRGGS